VSIPPSMLESMNPKYRPEPFESTSESSAAAVGRDLIDWLRSIRQSASSEVAEDSASRAIREWRRNQSWPVIEYAISRRRLWEQIWAPAVVVCAGLVLVFGGLEPQLRAKVLFLLTAYLFFLPSALKAMGRALLSNQRGSVRLENDELFYDPGLGRAPRTIRYDQMWDVDVSKDTSVVYVRYYPAEFDGQIDEERAAVLSVDFVQNAEELASELGKRVCGVTPRRSVTAKQTVKFILRLFGWLLLFVVAWIETTMIFSILAALRSV
jgi:hypothetical protein